MNDFFEFIYQFLPVFLGIAVMFLFKSITLIRHRIRIDVSSDFAMALEGDMPLEANTAIAKDSLRACFEREAKDRLIVEGLFAGRRYDAGIRKLALGKLGMMELRDIEELHGKVCDMDEITLVMRSLSELEDRIYRFDNVSGILLAYIIDCRLSVLEAKV